MALTTGTVWEFRSTATASMVNGGGFNPASAGTDYSLQDAAQLTNTDLTTSGAGSTTITSAGGGFTAAMVGNIVHITAGTNFQADWYEIASFTNANNVVLDRTPSSGAAGSVGTFYVGGALSLNSALDDAFFEAIPAASIIWMKSGAYTQGQAISVASTTSTSTNTSFVNGYLTTRGDGPTGTNRPSITQGANAWVNGQYINFSNIIFTGTAALMITTGVGSKYVNCKFTNTSVTGSRVCIAASAEACLIFCESVSQNGDALNCTNNGDKIYGCYLHDSNRGMICSASRMILSHSLIANNKTTGISLDSTTGSYSILNNTFYGSEAKIANGLLTSVNVIDTIVFNNIFYGLTTAINFNALRGSNIGDYNDFFNNTADVTNFTKGIHSLAINPNFVSASQVTGSTATTAASVLTQSGGDFSTVTDNISYLRVTSGTGVTTGIYLITSHTATTLTTNNALGTSSGGDVVYTVTVNNNFTPGAALKASAFPGLYGTQTTSYLMVGSVQRQEPTLASTFGG